MSEASELGTTIFNNAQIYASRAYATAIEVIHDLGTMPASVYLSGTGVPVIVIPISITPPPTLPVQVLPDDPVISANLSVTAPDPPDLTPQAYSDDFLVVIRQWFTDRLTGGGSGIVQQQAIYGFEDNRNTDTLTSAQARISSNQSPWAYPTGCESAALSRFEFDNVNVGLDVVRERRVNEERYSTEQLKFAISSGVELEKALMLYGPEIAKTLAYMFAQEVGAYDAEVAGSLASITVIVEEYNALINAYEAQTNANEGTAKNYGKLLDVESRAARKQAAIIIGGIEPQVQAYITLASNQSATMLDLAKSGMAMCGGAMAAATANANLSSSLGVSHSISETGSVTVSNETETNNIVNNRS